jgi:tetratricopeptide (TPR) repeat protein
MRASFMVAACIIIAMAFFFRTGIRRRPLNKMPAPAPTQLNEIKPIPQAPAQLPTLEAKAQIPSSLQQCWDHLNQQIVESDEFRADVRANVGAIVDSWFYRQNDPPPEAPVQTAPSLFLLGLAKAGLLDGRKIETDDTQALEMLEQAHQLDPSNAAPPLYSAVIERRLGNEQAADQFLQQAQISANHFDSYVTTITKSLRSAVRTPADSLAVLEIISTIPIPDYSGLRGILNDDPSSRLSELLLQGALQSKRKRDMFDYISVEYAAGMALLKGTPEGSRYPTLKQLWAENPPALTSDRLFSELEKSCDISSLEPFLADFRD